MLTLVNAQNKALSKKQERNLLHQGNQQQYDLPASKCTLIFNPQDLETCSEEQLLQTTLSTQFSQKQQSDGCLDELKFQVDKMIPKKKGKGMTRAFSQFEDELILHLVDQFGPKFRKFVKFFSGRQAMTLKNRFYKCLRTDYLRDKEQARRGQGKNDRMGKEIRNTTQHNSCIRQKQQIQQCLEDLEFSKENKNIMGKCIDNLFTMFQNMYE